MMTNTILDLQHENSQIEIFNSEKTQIIGVHSFSNCKKLRQVVLNDDLTTLCSGAFKNCSNLEKIEIHPKIKIEFIPHECFKNCTSLEQITIPKSVKSISTSAFNGCKKLKKVVFESESVEIDDDAFVNCIELEEIIDLNNSIEKIGNNVFLGCKNLKSIILKKCSSIGSDAFRSCSSLEFVHLDIKTIPNKCFIYCGRLKKILSNSPINYIQSFALYGCNDLDNIDCISQDCIYDDFSLFNTKINGLKNSSFYKDGKTGKDNHLRRLKIGKNIFQIYV